MANLKETIISGLQNGSNVLKEIKYARKHGEDFTSLKGRVQANVAKYHKKSMQLILSDIFEQTDEAKTFRFVSADGSALPIFQAGQFINIFIKTPEGVTSSRPYSISSSPKQRAYYEITIARAKNGFVSHYMLDNAKAGDEFTVNGPAGYFVHNPVFQSKHSVFLAGGSGVTPFVSMVREICESGQSDRKIDFIYGARNPEVAIFHNELEEIAKNHSNINYHLIISDDIETKYEKGFIDANRIKNIVSDLNEPTFFICGPPIMSDFVTKALTELNIKPKNIKKESFGARQDIWNDKAWPKNISGDAVFTIKVMGKEIPAKANETVLQAMERAGLHHPVSCRTGLCSLCRLKLTSGEVFVPEGVLVRYADEKYGYIHSCKSYPISDLEINC